MVGESTFTAFLDVFGVFSLTSAITLTTSLKYIISLIPICGYKSTFVIPVTCGKSTFGIILSHYFIIFSPWSLPYMTDVFYALAAVTLNLQVIKFFWLFLTVMTYTLAVLSALRILFARITLPLFEPENFSKPVRRASKILPFAVLIPTIIFMFLEFIGL